MAEEVDNAAKDEKAPSMSFEDALARLEAIVYQLESGSLPLEESIKKFEEGMRLSKICGDKLSDAENKIEQLVKRNDGSLGWVEYNGQRPQNQ